jgi:hypothetical protein
MSVRPGAARAAGALAVLAWAACASSPAQPVIDLTPFVWTWSQISLGAIVIRYGFPEEPAAAGDDAAPAALLPVGAGATEARLASYRYGCAAADRETDAVCTVFLEFWLLELAPSREGAGDLVRDSHGREWYRRTLALEAGGAFSQYSRPLDAGRALAVTSYTTRAPDRVAARDLARDAIDRVVIAAQPE